MATAPVHPCPKRMTYGPCGGVRPDGQCELVDQPWTFGHLQEPVRWSSESWIPPALEPRSSLLAALAGGRAVLTDLSLPL